MSETRIERAARIVVEALQELLTADYFDNPTGDGPYVTQRSIDFLAHAIADEIVSRNPKHSKAIVDSYVSILERVEHERVKIIRARNRLKVVR